MGAEITGVLSNLPGVAKARTDVGSWTIDIEIGQAPLPELFR